MKKDNERTEGKRRIEKQRKRFLNVIYFIDSNRTRTLKFSIGTSYLTVGLLTAAVVWSIISTTLLIRDRYIISKMSEHTTSLLETVFTYQTRYDEVYEKAYPDNEASQLTAEKDAKKIQEVEKAPVAEPVPETAVVDKTPAASPKEKTISQARPSTEPTISIDNFSTHLNEKNLMIRLALKNLNTTAKVSGSVRATAKFIDQTEKSYTLESHPTRTRDDNGNDEHFNIRYFKNKAFYFEPPKGVAGRFTDVVVTIRDDEGRSREFPYPINKEMLVREPSPASTRSAPIVKATDEEIKDSTQTDDIEPTPAESAAPASVPAN